MEVGNLKHPKNHDHLGNLTHDGDAGKGNADDPNNAKVGGWWRGGAKRIWGNYGWNIAGRNNHSGSAMYTSQEREEGGGEYLPNPPDGRGNATQGQDYGTASERTGNAELGKSYRG